MSSNQVMARKMLGYHGRKQEGYEGNLRTRGGLLNYHEDGSGNIMDVTDRIGEPIMKYRYDAFGNLFTHMAAPHNTIGFSGKSYDAKASLVDFSARWYSPNEGRFITEDTFPGWKDNPVSLNRYSYVHNNPVTLIDPTGRQAESIEWSGQLVERGDRGDYVADLQQMLWNVGFSPGPIDGIFGGQTEGALIGFQDYANIAVDGIAGPQTYHALVQYGGLGGSSSGGSTGSGGGSSGTVTPPPPTRAEIIAMRSGHFRTVSGGIPSYSVQTAQSVKNQYVFSSPSLSSYGFDFKPSFSAIAGLAKIKKFRLPSSSAFKRQVGSVVLDFIPVVGNLKSGLEAIEGRDLVTGQKLSVTERLIVGVGIFTGGLGKSALKGASAGLGFAFKSSKGKGKPAGKTVDPLTGKEVGRFIVDPKGNTMIEPVGGKTVPAGYKGRDTHTLYPNGSNYQRLNPQGHPPKSYEPHGHGHLEGTGPGMRGQGPSLDVFGNKVPFYRPGAHWRIK
jgi:RHS repeat-associated protein